MALRTLLCVPRRGFATEPVVAQPLLEEPAAASHQLRTALLRLAGVCSLGVGLSLLYRTTRSNDIDGPSMEKQQTLNIPFRGKKAKPPPPPLVGRDDDIARLERVLSLPPTGVTLVCALPGAGASALLRTVVSRREAAGALPLPSLLRCRRGDCASPGALAAALGDRLKSSWQARVASLYHVHSPADG